MIDTLLSYVAPHYCYNCGQSGSVLCHSCYDDIISEDFGRCAWCLGSSFQGNQCRKCAGIIGTSGTWVVGERSEILQKLVGDYKYESVHAAVHPLANLLDDTIAVLPSATVITSVPTIDQHIRQRGFDHAKHIAEELACRRKLTYTSLLRRRHQTAQHDLTKSQRLQAARDAFALKQSEEPPTVLLIDDIITTGTTLRACVQLLTEAGAQVYVAVVARQMLK